MASTQSNSNNKKKKLSEKEVLQLLMELRLYENEHNATILDDWVEYIAKKQSRDLIELDALKKIIDDLLVKVISNKEGVFFPKKKKQTKEEEQKTVAKQPIDKKVRRQALITPKLEIKTDLLEKYPLMNSAKKGGFYSTIPSKRIEVLETQLKLMKQAVEEVTLSDSLKDIRRSEIVLKRSRKQVEESLMVYEKLNEALEELDPYITSAKNEEIHSKSKKLLSECGDALAYAIESYFPEALEKHVKDNEKATDIDDPERLTVKSAFHAFFRGLVKWVQEDQEDKVLDSKKQDYIKEGFSFLRVVVAKIGSITGNNVVLGEEESKSFNSFHKSFDDAVFLIVRPFKRLKALLQTNTFRDKDIESDSEVGKSVGRITKKDFDQNILEFPDAENAAVLSTIDFEKAISEEKIDLILSIDSVEGVGNQLGVS